MSGDLQHLGVDEEKSGLDHDLDSYEGMNDYMRDVVRAIADTLCEFDIQAEQMLDKMVELAPPFRPQADRFQEAAPSLKKSFYADDDFFDDNGSFEVVRECADAFAVLRWGFTSVFDMEVPGSGVATNGSVPSRAHTCSARARSAAAPPPLLISERQNLASGCARVQQGHVGSHGDRGRPALLDVQRDCQPGRADACRRSDAGFVPARNRPPMLMWTLHPLYEIQPQPPPTGMQGVEEQSTNRIINFSSATAPHATTRGLHAPTPPS